MRTRLRAEALFLRTSLLGLMLLLGTCDVASAQRPTTYTQYRTALQQGRPDEAQRIARQAMEAAQRRGAVYEAGGWADLLGSTYLYAERFAEAEPLVRWALATFEKRYGEQLETMNVVDHLGEALSGQGKYQEAEQLFRRSLATRTRLVGPQGKEVSFSLEHLTLLTTKLGRYAEADELARRSLAINERLQRVDGIRQDLLNLADISGLQGRLAEAEAIYLRVIEQTEKRVGAGPLDLVGPSNNLASIYKDQARFAEAEKLLVRGLIISQKVLGPESPMVGKLFGNLGAIYVEQGRFDEGAFLIRQALRIYLKVLGPKHPDLSAPLNNLGDAALNTHNFDDAEKSFELALAIDEKAFGPNHRTTALRVHNLGLIAEFRGKLPEAETRYRDALARRENALGKSHPDTGLSLTTLGRLLHREGRDDQALEAVDRALVILDQPNGRSAWCAEARRIRAQVLWSLGKRPVAIAELEKALDVDEQLRSNASGSFQDVATVYARSSHAFELMAQYQAELGDVEKSFAAVERFRARSLLDEMRLAGSDFTEGMPPEVRQRVRVHDHDLNARINRIGRQLAEISKEREQERPPLEQALAESRRELADFDRDVRANSLVYRRLLAGKTEVSTLVEIQNDLLKDGDLLLVYEFSHDHGLVFALTRGSARVEPLALTLDQAKALEISPGPLTREKVCSALSGERDSAVVTRLSNPTGAVPREALFALWETLIPAAERKALVEGKYRRLLVAPDASMSLLPFETLVVERDGPLKYLLDVGPPIAYGPSCTILKMLSGADSHASKADNGSARVLALGDPAYPDPRVAERAPAVSGDAARFRGAGGALPRLPFSKLEAQWVAKDFLDQGLKAVSLIGPNATERAFRQSAPGRRFVHLACHGLVDENFRNAFGALALTPGPDPVGDSSDDGFLNLRELYAVDLRGCELAILSACQTNRSELEVGEGSWALSRGFLVAGARRVVASNWVVDDEAAANLVMVFCARLAKAEKAGAPLECAAALQEAKRWTRGQEKWKSPYFWASLVLVGPP